MDAQTHARTRTSFHDVTMALHTALIQCNENELAELRETLDAWRADNPCTALSLRRNIPAFAAVLDAITAAHDFVLAECEWQQTNAAWNAERATMHEWNAADVHAFAYGGTD